MIEGSALVVGEALIDVIVDGSGAETRAVGGSPANVALGMSRLGMSVELLTHLAADDDGARVVRHLGASGVQVLPASFSASRTPTARARITADGSAAYEFDVTWELPAPDDIIGSADLLHLGSYSSLRGDTTSTIDRLVGEARRRGALISYDPNIRKELVGNAEAVRDRFEHMLAQVNVVKLSDEDAAWLLPDIPVGDVPAALLERGPKLAVITLGSRGSILATRECVVRMSAPRVLVTDTVGAGDSYMAALAQAVAHVDLDAVDVSALQWVGSRCAAAAAITVGRRGADLPWSADLEG